MPGLSDVEMNQGELCSALSWNTALTQREALCRELRNESQPRHEAELLYVVLPGSRAAESPTCPLLASARSPEQAKAGRSVFWNREQLAKLQCHNVA